MIKNISIGIDVGSSAVRVVVAELARGEKTEGGQRSPKIIGVGESVSQGMRHGFVADPSSVTESVRRAVQAAEKSSGIKIRRAYLSLSGASLRGEAAGGVAIVSKANGEVTSLDTGNALEDCEEGLNLSNKKVIQVYPLSYRLDGKEVLGRLEGMRGTKLEVKALVVTYSIQHLEDLLEAVAAAGVEAIDVLATPIILGEIALSQKQKIVGVALVDIGAELSTLAVFENGQPVSIHTFPIGGGDITNDLALGLKIPLETAENLKLGHESEEFNEKKVRDIVEARLSDIFELIENHLKKIKRSELLPAGIVFVGGGAMTRGLADAAKSVLKLPATIGTTDIFGSTKTKLRDPSWLTALALVVGKDGGSYGESTGKNIFRDLKNLLKLGAKQLLP